MNIRSQYERFTRGTPESLPQQMWRGSKELAYDNRPLLYGLLGVAAAAVGYLGYKQLTQQAALRRANENVTPEELRARTTPRPSHEVHAQHDVAFRRPLSGDMSSVN